MVTLPAAIFVLVWNIVWDLRRVKRNRILQPMETEIIEHGSFRANAEKAALGTGVTEDTILVAENPSQADRLPSSAAVEAGRAVDANIVAASLLQGTTTQPTGRMAKWLYRQLPTVYDVTIRMPWKICPFIVGMFILVEGLCHVQIVDLIAVGFNNMLNIGNNPGGSFPIAVFSVAFISAGGKSWLSDHLILCSVLPDE